MASQYMIDTINHIIRLVGDKKFPTVWTIIDYLHDRLTEEGLEEIYNRINDPVKFHRIKRIMNNDPNCPSWAPVKMGHPRQGTEEEGRWFLVWPGQRMSSSTKKRNYDKGTFSSLNVIENRARYNRNVTLRAKSAETNRARSVIYNLDEHYVNFIIALTEARKRA